MLEMNEKIELINKKLNKLQEKNKESENNSFDEEIGLDTESDIINKTHKFEKLDNGKYKEILPESKKVTPDNFMELINIIIADYINYPNYYHFFNIQNIYNILLNEKMKVDNDNKKNDSEKLSNQEITVILSIDGQTRNIKIYLRDSIRDICKYANINSNRYNLIYYGKTINEESSLEDIINEDDKKIKIVRFLLREKNKMRNKIKSKDIICPRCGESIFMNIKDYKINLFNCINKHKINNLLLNEFEQRQNIDLSKIICNLCKKTKAEMEEYYDKLYICLTCRINLCSYCRVKHDKNHNIINYDMKDYICIEHNETYKYYCSECKLNICSKCESKHKSHNIIMFNCHNKGQLLNEIDKLKNDIDNLNKSIDEIIDKFLDFKYKINLYNQTFKNMVNNYEDKNVNYQIIQNIKEILDFKKCISNDILTIINENDINKRFKYVMDLNYKMNNINEEDNSNEKISHKFLRQPEKLKYKLNITETNDFKGVNDLFEVFVCKNDHKEYVVSKNINDYNLDIYTLLDNKKLLSLQGHKNRITTIRYFMDNIYNDEYLISADINGIVILWDIINNYKIKYQINTGYNISSDKGLVIYSCLLIFDRNNKDNYIITSINNTSEDVNKSGTKIYSLNNGQFIKCIYKSNKIKILYLLSWHNKKNNQYYIVQFGSENIFIYNLSSDELYSDFIQKSEGLNYSGFIYQKKDDEYLLSCSTNGNINIWDLYNKKIYKTINSDNCRLMSIIKWNDKYAIVSELNNSIKIIDIEKLTIVHKIEGKYTEGIKCIKKIYHPTYGESLLSTGRDKIIKLWTI